MSNDEMWWIGNANQQCYSITNKEIWYSSNEWAIIFIVELNQMPCRPTRQRVLINHQQASNDSSLPTIATVPDLADHPLGNNVFDCCFYYMPCIYYTSLQNEVICLTYLLLKCICNDIYSSVIAIVSCVIY